MANEIPPIMAKQQDELHVIQYLPIIVKAYTPKTIVQATQIILTGNLSQKRIILPIVAPIITKYIPYLINLLILSIILTLSPILKAIIQKICPSIKKHVPITKLDSSLDIKKTSPIRQSPKPISVILGTRCYLNLFLSCRYKIMSIIGIGLSNCRQQILKYSPITSSILITSIAKFKSGNYFNLTPLFNRCTNFFLSIIFQIFIINYIIYNQTKQIMKRKITKGNTHKILEEQSQKLKSKLQLLKQQIQLKKKEKESNKNTKLSQSNINKNNGNYGIIKESKSKVQFSKFLTDLKMENIEFKLLQKEIKSIKDFSNLKSQEIDKWKDIAVGYRIKIKKYLSKIHENKQILSQQKSESIQRSKSTQKNIDIQQIIINRNKDKTFIPIHAHFKENQDHQDEQLGEEQQEKMINNLMNAFQVIDIKDEEQYDYQQKQHKNKQQFVKHTDNLSKIQSQPIWRQIKVYPDYKYCWSCLNFINQSNNKQYNNRQFCSQKCINTYKTSLNRQNDDQFFTSVQKTQKKFNQLLKNRQKNENNSQKIIRISEQQIEELDEIEQINFSIV